MKIFVEMVKAGVIGKIHESISGAARTGAAATRPTDTPPVPETLDWDLWLGPAPYRPYHPKYLPGEWRRWWDFGTGTLGDMGCHIIDPAWWALDLKYPTSVEAQPGPFNKETYPEYTDRDLGIPRPRRPAAGDGDLVRRQEPAAPAARNWKKAARCRTKAESTTARRERSSCRTAAIPG